MRVFYVDVDGTLVDDEDETKARPGGPEAVRGLIERGHEVYLWSSRGKEFAEAAARRFALPVAGCMSKPTVIVDDKRDRLRSRLSLILEPDWQAIGQRFLNWKRRAPHGGPGVRKAG